MTSLNEQILRNLECEKRYCLESGNKDRLNFLNREIERVKLEIEEEKKQNEMR